MGNPDILGKLHVKFLSVPKTEEDIIFILSRVRKVLDYENQGIGSKYGILRFYCNLALHTTIEKVPQILAREFRRVHDELAFEHPLLGYKDFHEQLKLFMKEHELPNFYENSDFKYQSFIELLNSIYSGTPVTVSFAKQYKIVVNPDGTITGSISNE